MSLSLSFVDGQKYTTEVINMGGGGGDLQCVFIPSYKLEFSADGRASISDKGVTSKEATKLIREMIRSKKPYSDKDYENAHQQGKQIIQVPLDFIQKMETLLAEENELKSKLVVNQAKVRELIHQSDIFSAKDNK